MDVDAYRRISHERWERAAAGWARRRSAMQRLAAPVSEWMVSRIEPAPGQVALELAAGPGDTGLMVAPRLAPGGRLICSDFSPAMLEVARERARELGVANVDLRVLDAESLDLQSASVDAVLCRWGYMLMADPQGALRESRRVLVARGRVALAAWDAPQRNPWVSLPSDEAQRRSGEPPPPPGAPGMFAFAPPGHLEALLARAGFEQIVVEGLDLEMTYADFDDWWAATLDLSRPFADVVESSTPAEVKDMRAALARAARPFTGAGGELRLPGRPLLAAACAPENAADRERVTDV